MHLRLGRRGRLSTVYLKIIPGIWLDIRVNSYVFTGARRRLRKNMVVKCSLVAKICSIFKENREKSRENCISEEDFSFPDSVDGTFKGKDRIFCKLPHKG